jgi:hypothetical protein
VKRRWGSPPNSGANACGCPCRNDNSNRELVIRETTAEDGGVPLIVACTAVVVVAEDVKEAR